MFSIIMKKLMNFDFETLIPVILVAVLTILGNIFFFKYQFKKENKWKLLQQQLTEFLLPLFYIFKKYKLDAITNSDDCFSEISGEKI